MHLVKDASASGRVRFLYVITNEILDQALRLQAYTRVEFESHHDVNIRQGEDREGAYRQARRVT